MSPTPSVARAKIWLEKEGEALIGRGRAELLEAIDRTGSIRQAALELGLSYRHAWGVVSRIGKAYGSPVVVSRRGGKKGGSTRLSEAGRKLVEMYRRAERASQLALDSGGFEEFLVVSVDRPGRRLEAISPDGSRTLSVRVEGEPVSIKPGTRILVKTIS